MDPNFRPMSNDRLPTYCTWVLVGCDKSEKTQGSTLLIASFLSPLTQISSKLQGSITCVQNYGKNCLKGFTKQTLTIGLHGMKKHQKSICGPNAPLANGKFNFL